MTQAKRLAVIGTVTLFLGLVALFPARIAYRWMAPIELSLAGISGTIWRGAAAEGQVAGVYMRNLTWQFKPLSLFIGKLAVAMQLDVAGGSVDTKVAIGFDGILTLSDFDGNAPIRSLGQVMQIAGMDGRINAQFSKLQFSNGIPIAADGVVHIINLFIGQLAPTGIGDFEAKFSTTNDGIIASVDDTAGILDLEAVTLRLTSDRLYSLIGMVAPNSTTPSAVVEQLSFLGSPNDLGQREFRFEGEL